MKANFNLTLHGEDSLKKKIDEAFAKPFDFDKEIIYTLSKIIVVSCNLNIEDKVTIDGFNITYEEDEKVETPPQITVENEPS